MTPDSALGALQERVAKLEQRTDDLASRAIEKFTEVADDFKVFGPMLQDQAAMRADFRHITETVDRVAGSQEKLEQRIEEERRERIAGQQARKEELEAAIAERNLEMRMMEDREKEREDKRQQQHRDVRKFYLQLMAGIASIFLTSLGGVVVAWVSSRGGVK